MPYKVSKNFELDKLTSKEFVLNNWIKEFATLFHKTVNEYSSFCVVNWGRYANGTENNIRSSLKFCLY